MGSMPIRLWDGEKPSEMIKVSVVELPIQPGIPKREVVFVLATTHREIGIQFREGNSDFLKIHEKLG